MVGILVLLGTGCVVGAAVGRRVKIRRKDSKVRGPLIATRGRQLLLTSVGVVCLAAGGYLQIQDRDRPGALPAATIHLDGKADTAPTNASDPLAGVWKAPDGATMRFHRTGDRYEVKLSKPNGFTDEGTASLKGSKVSVSFKNKYVGSYTAELVVAGNRLSGSYVVSGVQLPATLSR